MKRGRQILLIVASCAIVAVVAILVWPGEREPEYQGKKLSEWIRGGFFTKEGSPQGQKRVEAVRDIGAKGLPFLIKWISYGEQPTLTKLDIMIEKRGGRLWDKWSDWKFSRMHRVADAMWAFRALGPTASPAMPELIQLLRSTNIVTSRVAVYALDSIGREAIPVLLGVLTNRHAYGLKGTVTLDGTMEHLGTNSVLVLPTLIQCLTNENPEIAGTAAGLMRVMIAYPDPVVPALTRCLHHREPRARWSAAYALAKFREQAKSAVPSLIGALGDPSRTVRFAATNALVHIAPEVLQTNAVSER